MNIENIDIAKLSIYNPSKNSKKYFNIAHDGHQITINNLQCHIPFGVEKYNDKLLLNIELVETNENSNILSKIDSIEKLIKSKFPNFGLMPCHKKSKLGCLLRTHYTKNTECFILKKNNEKMMIDKVNLNLADCEVNLSIKGVWFNDNNCGIYITIDSIRVIKFN